MAETELIGWPSEDGSQHNVNCVGEVDPLPNVGQDEGQQLSESIAERFLLGYSDNTLTGYTGDLRSFFGWCALMDLIPLAAQRHHLERYQKQLVIKQRLAPATVSRKLSAVSGFFSYGVDVGVIKRNPTKGVQRPRIDNVPTTAALTREEVAAALAAASNDPRLFALISLLFITGMRISSALDLDVADLRHEQGFYVARFTAKGAKHGVAVLPPTTRRAVHAYLGSRDTGPLFLGLRGGRWNRSEAWRSLQRLAMVTLPDRPNGLHPHAFRAAFCSAAHLAGVDLIDISESALHSSVSVTQRYIRVRGRLDRHPANTLEQFLADADVPDH